GSGAVPGQREVVEHVRARSGLGPDALAKIATWRIAGTGVHEFGAIGVPGLVTEIDRGAVRRAARAVAFGGLRELIQAGDRRTQLQLVGDRRLLTEMTGIACARHVSRRRPVAGRRDRTGG